MKKRYAIKSKYDRFTHHVGDTETLEEIIHGLTDDEDEAARIASVASHMKIGDGFATDGILLTCGEDE